MPWHGHAASRIFQCSCKVPKSSISTNRYPILCDDMRNIAEVHELLPGSSAQKLSKDLCYSGSWWRSFAPRARAKDHIIPCRLMMSNETRFSSHESTSAALAWVPVSSIHCAFNLIVHMHWRALCVCLRALKFPWYSDILWCMFCSLNPPVVLQNQIAGASAPDETIWNQCRPVGIMISYLLLYRIPFYVSMHSMNLCVNGVS